MTTLGNLWSFGLVVGLLTLTPGMDTALILRTAALGAPRRAWGVVLGIQSGTMIWGALAAAGVTAVLTASHLAYELLRWAGAAYLIAMGLRMIAETRGSRRAQPPAENEAPPAGDDFFPGWRRGVMTNLLNPKMGVFYFALLPQFIPAGVPVLGYGLLLTGVHVVLGTAWSAVLVALAHRLRRVLRRPAVRRWMDRVTGTVITGFGVRLAAGRG